jgi:hypothetical protein
MSPSAPKIEAIGQAKSGMSAARATIVAATNA